MGKIIRSDVALLAVPILFKNKASLFVFVEDHDERGVNEKFYQILLKRIFDNCEFKIITVGGRERVIKLNKKYLDNASYTALFIIDGDFKILHSPKERLPLGLFRLNKYCIENYLIQKEAINEVLYENHSNMDLHSIEKTLKFEEWKQHICSVTEKLVVLFAICDRLNMKHVQTSKRDLKDYKPCDTGMLLAEAISDIEQKIIDKLYGQNTEKVEAITVGIEKEIKDKKLTPMDTLSGKSLLLPLIFKRSLHLIEHKCRDLEIFKQRLADKCALLDLYAMKDAVHHVDTT